MVSPAIGVIAILAVACFAISVVAVFAWRRAKPNGVSIVQHVQDRVAEFLPVKIQPPVHSSSLNVGQRPPPNLRAGQREFDLHEMEHDWDINGSRGGTDCLSPIGPTSLTDVPSAQAWRPVAKRVEVNWESVGSLEEEATQAHPPTPTADTAPAVVEEPDHSHVDSPSKVLDMSAVSIGTPPKAPRTKPPPPEEPPRKSPLYFPIIAPKSALVAQTVARASRVGVAEQRRRAAEGRRGPWCNDVKCKVPPYAPPPEKVVDNTYDWEEHLREYLPNERKRSLSSTGTGTVTKGTTGTATRPGSSAGPRSRSASASLTKDRVQQCAFCLSGIAVGHVLCPCPTAAALCPPCVAQFVGARNAQQHKLFCPIHPAARDRVFSANALLLRVPGAVAAGYARVLQERGGRDGAGLLPAKCRCGAVLHEKARRVQVGARVEKRDLVPCTKCSAYTCRMCGESVDCKNPLGLTVGLENSCIYHACAKNIRVYIGRILSRVSLLICADPLCPGNMIPQKISGASNCVSCLSCGLFQCALCGQSLGQDEDEALRTYPHYDNEMSEPCALAFASGAPHKARLHKEKAAKLLRSFLSQFSLGRRRDIVCNIAKEALGEVGLGKEELLSDSAPGGNDVFFVAPLGGYELRDAEDAPAPGRREGRQLLRQIISHGGNKENVRASADPTGDKLVLTAAWLAQQANEEYEADEFLSGLFPDPNLQPLAKARGVFKPITNNIQ